MPEVTMSIGLLGFPGFQGFSSAVLCWFLQLLRRRLFLPGIELRRLCEAPQGSLGVFCGALDVRVLGVLALPGVSVCVCVCVRVHAVLCDPCMLSGGENHRG